MVRDEKQWCRLALVSMANVNALTSMLWWASLICFRQIRELQLGTSQPLGFCVENAVQAITSLGVCFYYSWKITLVTLAGIPLSAICMSSLASTMQSSIKSQDIEMAKASGIAINALTGIDTVKCFNGQESEARKYS